MGMVEFYLEGKVDVWFQSLKLIKPELVWGEFSAALLQRFGGRDGNDTVGEFNKLVQHGSVLEYVERFEELRLLMLCQNSKLTEEYFISSFISGLKEELKPMVWMMTPRNLMAVFEVAQWQERTVELVTKKARPCIKQLGEGEGRSAGGFGRGGFVARNNGGIEGKQMNQGANGEAIKKITPQELQYRRNNNLCYKCGDKYTPGHRCKWQQFTFIIEEEYSREREENGSEDQNKEVDGEG